MSGFSSGEPQIFAEVGRRWANPNADADAGALSRKEIGDREIEHKQIVFSLITQLQTAPGKDSHLEHGSCESERFC